MRSASAPLVGRAGRVAFCFPVHPVIVVDQMSPGVGSDHDVVVCDVQHPSLDSTLSVCPTRCTNYIGVVGPVGIEPRPMDYESSDPRPATSLGSFQAHFIVAKCHFIRVCPASPEVFVSKRLSVCQLHIVQLLTLRHSRTLPHCSKRTKLDPPIRLTIVTTVRLPCASSSASGSPSMKRYGRSAWPFPRGTIRPRLRPELPQPRSAPRAWRLPL